MDCKPEPVHKVKNLHLSATEARGAQKPHGVDRTVRRVHVQRLLPAMRRAAASGKGEAGLEVAQGQLPAVGDAHGADGAPVLAYLHSYRPAAELAEVLTAAAASGAGGVWVQRYGYLSDEKLAVLRDAWAAGVGG